VVKEIALMSALCFSFFETTFVTKPVLAEDRARTVTALAPADRYFGQLKMSVLGIRNAIKDISLRTNVAPSGDMQPLFRKLTFVEDAITDLKTQFPKDSWIPQFGLSLAQAFMKMHVADAAVRANDAIDWVIAEYPRTDQALFAKGLRSASFAAAPSADAIPIEPIIAYPERQP